MRLLNQEYTKNHTVMKRQFYFLLMMLAMGVVSCDIIIKPDPNTVTTNVDSIVVNVKVVGDTVVDLVVKTPEQAPVDIAECDMAMLDKGKLYFYSSSKNAMTPYEAETDSVVNCIFTNDGRLYYCVPVNERMMLRSLDLNEPDPQPTQVADWGVDYEKCVTETYGTVSPLSYYPDRNTLGLWHEFSWDSYMLTKQKLCNLSTGKITDWNHENLDGQKAEDKLDEYLQNEEEQFWYTDGGKVCLTDKIDFSQYASDPDYATEPEFNYLSSSPDNAKVLYAAILEWGDYPHGILAVSSLDGKTQIPLEDTDCTGFIADWLADGSLVYVGEMPLSPDDPNYDANWHYRTHCIKRVFPDGHTEIIAPCGDFKVKKL